MDLKQIVILALQVSIVSTVFGLGLQATSADLLYLIRRPGLLARSLLAVFVIMPAVALVLVRVFDFPPAVEIVLVALAISPVPPLLPKKQTEAGGEASFGLGLMAILALVSIVAVPATLEVLERVFGRPMALASAVVSGVVVKTVLVPLAAGMALRAVLPEIAERLGKVAARVVKVLLPLAVLALLASTFSAIWALIGSGTVLAIVIFTAAGLGIGHVLGGPAPNQSTVLALATACRHPAIAFAIAATNFPDQRFGALILLYLIVSGVVGIPYIKWQQRREARFRTPDPLHSGEMARADIR